MSLYTSCTHGHWGEQMKTMPNHVVRIGRNYYFRVRTPFDLTCRFDCHEFKISLYTDDLPKAASTAKLLHTYALNLFSKARNNFMEKKLYLALLKAEAKRLLEENEKGLALQALDSPEKKLTQSQDHHSGHCPSGGGQHGHGGPRAQQPPAGARSHGPARD